MYQRAKHLRPYYNHYYHFYHYHYYHHHLTSTSTEACIWNMMKEKGTVVRRTKPLGWGSISFSSRSGGVGGGGGGGSGGSSSRGRREEEVSDRMGKEANWFYQQGMLRG